MNYTQNFDKQNLDCEFNMKEKVGSSKLEHKSLVTYRMLGSETGYRYFSF